MFLIIFLERDASALVSYAPKWNHLSPNTYTDGREVNELFHYSCHELLLLFHSPAFFIFLVGDGGSATGIVFRSGLDALYSAFREFCKMNKCLADSLIGREAMSATRTPAPMLIDSLVMGTSGKLT